MSIPLITIHDIETGELITREMNEQELVQREIDAANAISRQEAETAKAAAKAALLDRLGITEDEAKLLLA